MASIYQRKGSPFWWIKYHDRGQLRRESTGHRLDDLGSRRARILCAEKSLAEAVGKPDCPPEFWDRWALQFLDAHTKHPPTLAIQRAKWIYYLAPFLKEKNVKAPRELQFSHIDEYVSWRRGRNGRNKNAPVKTSVIKKDLQVLGKLMGQAVKRGYALANPCRAMGIAAEPAAVKPEFTDEHLGLIEKAIAAIGPETGRTPGLRDFMYVSFMIGRYQGCRICETYLNPLTDVQIAPDNLSGRIRFRIKGGQDHVAPLHPKLVPLFQRLKAEGKTETYIPRGGPSNRGASGFWSTFLHHTPALVGKLPPGACFHSFRVTVISRLARTNISSVRTMAYVGHASFTVHQIYQRFHCDELGDCSAAIG